LRKLLAEGLFRRYTIHAKAEGKEFVVEGIDDPTRLPTYPKPEVGSHNSEQKALRNPEVAAAIKAVMDRLQLELKVIEKTGFISYFLIVGDFIRYGREHGIPAWRAVRAAGSIVTYLLEIANVDPIRYGLLFERFLNPERVNPPDIDIDFADDRRADVIEYVREKYGAIPSRKSSPSARWAQIRRARRGPRDGIELRRMRPAGQNDSQRLKMTLEKALKQSPEFKEAYETEEVTRELIDTRSSSKTSRATPASTPPASSSATSRW
jgi:DNA polymerase III alpha subunit